jgi:glutamate synthase domain-containing protein 2
MIPDERRYSSKWLYQCIQSRYGFNPNHLRLADCCEFFIGQGCKVGLGGHLMGQKVTDQVAEMRSLPAGIDQRSPARHPDWLGPDDLALKIQEVREATNGEIPIQLKLGAARVYDDVRMAAKTGPASIYLDGMKVHGAGPHIATEETGIPGIAAIRQARKALDDVGKSGEISVYAGDPNGDIAKALALSRRGCDRHGGSDRLNCNKDIPEAIRYDWRGGRLLLSPPHRTVPGGIATQDPELRKRLNPDEGAVRVYNFRTR